MAVGALILASFDLLTVPRHVRRPTLSLELLEVLFPVKMVPAHIC